MHNKKLASEVAIGIVLLLAIVVGGFSWAQNRQSEFFNDAGRSYVAQPTVKPVESANEDDKQQPVQVANEDGGSGCVGRLYEGEAVLRGSYVLDTIPGSTKREWLFKVAAEDMDKLPGKAKVEMDKTVNNLLFITDATPEMTTRLKKATDAAPESITIKGFYLDCVGVSVVSIEPATIALAKYVKKQ